MGDMGWRFFGACADEDPDLMYGDGWVAEQAAKAVCSRCLVRADCLRWALERHERAGVWGGLTYAERKQLRPVEPGVDCGTPTGYYRHRRRGEVCAVCRSAYNAHVAAQMRLRRAEQRAAA
jgi:WhiB family redox-sensing transcriptional regulator